MHICAGRMRLNLGSAFGRRYLSSPQIFVIFCYIQCENVNHENSKYYWYYYWSVRIQALLNIYTFSVQFDSFEHIKYTLWKNQLYSYFLNEAHAQILQDLFFWSTLKLIRTNVMLVTHYMARQKSVYILFDSSNNGSFFSAHIIELLFFSLQCL